MLAQGPLPAHPARPALHRAHAPGGGSSCAVLPERALMAGPAY
jgi:hypothetical protein